MKLTVRETMWERMGQVYGTGSPINFDVEGLPPGQEACIANFGGPSFDKWKILLVNDGVYGKWTGNHASVGQALAAIERR